MDEAAFRLLFSAQFDDVWRFARRRCPSGVHADDVAAEVFAVAWRRRNDIPVGDAARLWLFGTARLVLTNHRRGDRRRAGLDARLRSVAPLPGPTDPADLIADRDADPLLAALATLAPADRDLLVMRAWDGLAVADIAVLLDCTPNAASVRLSKARSRLADALARTRAASGDADPHAVPTDRHADRTRRGRAPNPGGGPR